jgi:ribosomal protein L11 methyltransferase
MTLDAASVAAFTDALLAAGAVSVDIADRHAGSGDERPIFAEPGEEPLLAWGDNRVAALFPADSDLAAALQLAREIAGLDALPAWRASRIEDRDWVRITQNQFQPIRVTQRMWIVPTWHEPPDRAAINILLDPGLAFGTGSHATTRLCLEWLADHLHEGESVIDYGCGSGILAIAAVKLGAGPVVGIDIDPQALESSRYNASVNRVAALFQPAAGAPPLPADVVIANILSAPLKVLAPLLARLTRPGGRIVLSGVLAAQAGEVAASYREWFAMRPPVVEEGWARLEGSRLPADGGRG